MNHNANRHAWFRFIPLNDADDAERKKMHALMCEPYHTLLGHFRHEVGRVIKARLHTRDRPTDCRQQTRFPSRLQDAVTAR
ncbi:MAG: putative zinc-binding metallopeptidase [Acetobacteraceae bacterium]|nr:putative zinc-binding metallopeptidase [Acetobacteraceae bacterium]